MQEQILSKLLEIDRHFGVRILLAVESGSRAWGFASNDSDYDVRFVYVRPASDYQRLTKVPDVIDENYQFTLDEESLRQAYPNSTHVETFSGWEHPLDFSGWDLRKFLTSARDTGSSTYEWAFSPIVYFAAPDFLGDVQHVMGKHFNARASFHHYRNMAWKCLHQAFDTNSVKSALYALRCLLCAHYVYHYRQQPPVALTDLVQSFSVRSETVYRHIGVVHQFLMEHKQSENATAQLLPHRETLNLLAVTVEGVGAGNDVWGAPDHPDLELDNSTLMAYSRLLQKHHAP